MTYRSPLGRARGLGSAKDGTAHWWAQRLTSLALVPLVAWFTVSMIAMVGAEHAAFVLWLKSPAVAVTMVLLITVAFHHGQLGLQVIIEDYIHGEGVKLVLLIAVKFAAIVLALLGVFAVLKIALGG